jgi:hypothetical protein
MRVVDDEIGFRDAVAELDDFDVAIGFAADAFVAIFAEDQRLAVFELNDVFAARVFFGDAGPGAVIEDVAVLQNFDKRRAAMRSGLLEGVFQVDLEDVDGAGDKSGFRADGKGNGVEGRSSEPYGVDLAFFPISEVGEYWPLVRP